ncbi:MAG: response regulator [Clostridia bacterium]
MVSYNELIKNINILLADDDEDYLNMTYEFLLQYGYNVDIATDGLEALEKLKEKDYHIALLDYFMPKLNGDEVIDEIRKTNQELIIIIQTGFSGQKPPIETMQKLNIQNYHDKTDGIDSLNLEIISAVKIFNQQNEIEITKYRTNAIGDLIAGVAQVIKSALLSVGAGLEVTNMMVQDLTEIKKENIEKLSKFYLNNKISLEQVDKVLTSIIGQASNNTDCILLSSDVVEIISLILTMDSKQLGIKLNIKTALKSNSYLKGSVNDNIFIICEIVKKIMHQNEKNTTIDIVLTEDELNWFFIISNDKVNDITKNDFYLIKRLVLSLKDSQLDREKGKIILSMKK